MIDGNWIGPERPPTKGRCLEYSHRPKVKNLTQPVCSEQRVDVDCETVILSMDSNTDDDDSSRLNYRTYTKNSGVRRNSKLPYISSDTLASTGITKGEILESLDGDVDVLLVPKRTKIIKPGMIITVTFVL